MHNFRWWLAFSSAVLLKALPFSAHAVVNSEVTRVIFNAGDKSASLALINSPQQPALVQIWTDTGNPASQPNEETTPVIALPPVFKMQPGELRSITLQLTDTSALPRDREALYWLNVYQIPPMTQTDAQVTQKVVLPLRIRMKLFIRPKGVGALKESDAEKLRVSYVEPQKQLQITNPTPWHITLAGIRCESGSASGVMVAPLASVSVPLQGRGASCSSVHYEAINDHGTLWQYEKAVLRLP
ncbi:fimbria/pilus periplasmic chaperone [Citrobacter sp. ku-bf4]|uniref:fimbria/pilus periplasmic chaperone n=1 Tax=Citrobacter TaxID=544 RepID=UPI00197E13B7|nr:MULTISPECIES: fimbria/pilus periplasmic chaperone [Citrobacter]MBN6042995.1 fimbria/pilus periplasmic chaperone [Citrobacter sp. ku-bf4]MBS0824371.1 fimbria/pilus periplasmic chaperone [Citrobacter amalonaticus]